jgi:preprotein translocase subunit SecA
MAEAIATKNDDELNAYWEKNYLRPLPENMRYLSGDERTNAIRASVENIRRLELLRFERTILIETLDTHWKDHLYAMDQLRDTIGFRTFSQNDPRIEYKREGSQMFKDMLESVKLRVTELLFKARLTPPQPQQNFAPRPAPRPMAPAPTAGLGIIGPGIGGGISGPGLSGPAQA